MSNVGMKARILEAFAGTRIGPMQGSETPYLAVPIKRYCPRIAQVSKEKQKVFSGFVGRILVRDVFLWIRVAETSN